MSVFKKRPTDQTYFIDFRLKGRRFSVASEAKSRKEAEALEKRLKATALKDLEQEKKVGEGPLLLRHATGRFWDEVGQHHVSSGDTFTALGLLVEFLSPDKRLDQITDDDVAKLVAWRRAHTIKRGAKKGKLVSNATVNRTTVEILRKVMTRARTVWRVALPHEPIWKTHRLEEPKELVRELHEDEAEALGGALRADYEPWFTFARLTGLRLNETLLKWEHVNWSTGIITTIGKRGRTVRTFITPAVAAILEPLKGHHEEFVFTYVCRRPKKGQTLKARYPITYAGAKSEWRAMRARSGVKGFRFHDVRHDMATKLLRETGNLKLVSKALNHSDVATTARYAHVVDAELRDALQALSTTHAKSATKTATKEG